MGAGRKVTWYIGTYTDMPNYCIDDGTELGKAVHNGFKTFTIERMECIPSQIVHMITENAWNTWQTISQGTHQGEGVCTLLQVFVMFMTVIQSNVVHGPKYVL